MDTAKTYLKINECQKKVNLCISLEVVWIDAEGFTLKVLYFRYDEYKSPEWEEDYQYKLKLSLINDQTAQLIITWRFLDELTETIHVIDVGNNVKFGNNVKLDGVINETIEMHLVNIKKAK